MFPPGPILPESGDTEYLHQDSVSMPMTVTENFEDTLAHVVEVLLCTLKATCSSLPLKRNSRPAACLSIAGGAVSSVQEAG